MISIRLRQKAIYRYIIEYIKKNGFSPTVREIAEGVGLRSISTVSFHLQSLCQKGFLEINSKEPRAIKVVGYKFVKIYDVPME